MAHQIWEESFIACPRCKSEKVRIATYHFGATYRAECAKCSFGQSTGDNSAMALARLQGEYMEASQNIHEDSQARS